MRIVLSFILLGLAPTVSFPAAAQTVGGKFSLGIEVPALDIRHVSQDISVPSGVAGQSSTLSVGQTSTAFGLFAVGAGLNGQYGLSDQTIFGARVALRRETSKSDGSSAAAHSQLSLLPRFEYYMGPGDTVRPHLGLEVGYERSTSNGASGGTSNLWLIGPTGGVSYFPSPNWSVDVNASVFLITGSEDLGGLSAGTSGYGGVLRVALSSWLGSAPAAAQEAALPARAAEQTAPQRDTSAEARVVSGFRGAVRRELSIAPGLSLTLTTNPITSPDAVKFKLTIDGDSGAFAGCESFAVDFAGNKIHARGTHRLVRPGGFTAEDSMLGSLPIDVLDPGILEKGYPELVACQRHWALTSKNIGHMKELKDVSEMIARGEGLVAGDTSAIEMHDESVVTELLLSRDISLRFEARPLIKPHSVTARLISRDHAGVNSDCSNVSIHADATDLKLEDAHRSRLSTAEGTAQLVEGNLTFVALAHIAAGDDDEVVDACGYTANISPSNREQTWAFIAQTVALAMRVGAWHGFRTPPVPEPPPQETKAAQPDASKHKRK